MDTADNAGAKRNRPTDSGGCFLAGEHIAWKRTASAETVLFIFYSFSLESGSQPLNSSWYKLVLYLTVPQYTAIMFYAVVVLPPLTLSMESPLPDLTGLQVALSGLPFSFSSPSTLWLHYKAEFKFLQYSLRNITIYQATMTEPLNCSVTNFLTSSD